MHNEWWDRIGAGGWWSKSKLGQTRRNLVAKVLGHVVFSGIDEEKDDRRPSTSFTLQVSLERLLARGLGKFGWSSAQYALLQSHS